MSSRYERQEGVLPRDVMEHLYIHVIGVGAVGHAVARLLAPMGPKRIDLWDPQEVGVENLSSQGFTEGDLGYSKANIVTRECRALNSGIIINNNNRKFRTSFIKEQRATLGEGDKIVLFTCVDMMEDRKFIFEKTAQDVDIFIDTRMDTEVLRVLTSLGPNHDDYYRNTILSDEEATQGSCTTRSLIYTSSIMAGMAVGQLSKAVRNLPVMRDLHYSLLDYRITDLSQPKVMIDGEEAFGA